MFVYIVLRITETKKQIKTFLIHALYLGTIFKITSAFWQSFNQLLLSYLYVEAIYEEK